MWPFTKIHKFMGQRCCISCLVVIFLFICGCTKNTSNQPETPVIPKKIGSVHFISMEEIQKDNSVKDIYPLEVRMSSGYYAYQNTYLVRQNDDSVWFYEVKIRTWMGDNRTWMGDNMSIYINKVRIFSSTTKTNLELEKR